MVGLSDWISILLVLCFFFFFSSRRRHTRSLCDWSSDVCSSDLEVKDGFKEQESYARLDHKNVITLSVVKRKGENLIAASDKINALIDEMKENKWPKDLQVTLTGEQSKQKIGRASCRERVKEEEG